MKLTKFFLPLFSLMVLGMLTFTACGDSASAQNSDSKYMCPMECEGSSVDEPGKCPKCKMDLVLRHEEAGGHDHGAEGHDHGAEGHDHGAEGHDHGAEGHDHGDHEGHSH